MWIANLLVIPLVIAIVIFIITSKRTLKSRLIQLLVLILSVSVFYVAVNPSLVGLRSMRTKWIDYEVPNHFEYRIKTGFFGNELRGIDLKDEEPVFVIESDFKYEIYSGDYIYEGVYIAQEAYKWYDAIGVTVFDGDEIISKWILPSGMNVDSLELIDKNPITLRTSTDEMYYQFIIELDEFNEDSSNEANYYLALNETPKREYYIPYNQEFIERGSIDE